MPVSSKEALMRASPLMSLLVVCCALCVARSGLGASPSRVVFSEVMYHPFGDQDDLQFIEIHNPGDAAVDLSRWFLRGGVDFAFPRGASIPAGGYRVVCRNMAAFRACHGDSTNVIGTFTGSLSRKGERIELADAQGEVRDAVHYADRPPWPVAADGHGSSLERICAGAASNDPANWCASGIGAGGAFAGTPGRRNSCDSPVPLPRVVEVCHDRPVPGQPIGVSARVTDDAGVASVALHWEAWSADSPIAKGETPLIVDQAASDRARYVGAIPGQPESCLIRFVIQARSVSGAVRHCPSATDLHPTFTCATHINTNTARIPFLKLITFGRIQKPGVARRVQALAEESDRPPWATRMDWSCAAVVLPPGETGLLVFDHVRVRRRKGGYKIEFQPDRPWQGLRAVNLILEGSPRYLLSEPLAFELYRRAGVPSPATDHVRLWLDQHALGCHLVVEQPNRAFFRRLGQDPDGNLYKLLWYGDGVAGQHEKKTNPDTGHADLLDVIDGLRKTEGLARWDFIRQHFDVDELAGYFAVSMCIQNWDGFFNNYYAYHDPRPGGKWQIIPWDQDKTWGDYDGASPAYDWHEMPLTYGMAGDKPPRRSWLGGWPDAGAPWWRPPGWFSGPLLAEPHFREQFLARLRELCDTAFTEQTFGPAITALEQRIEPEVVYRASIERRDTEVALRRFRADIESFRGQLVNRRQFLLRQLAESKPLSSLEAGRAP